MAIRRMFSLQVVDTDKFIEMSISARLLYYELGMRADDDGFIASPKKIIRAVGCSEDDIRLLISKGFIIPKESGIVIIRHWKLNNYLQSDRYKKTIYQDEMKTLTIEGGVYNTDTPCIQDVSVGKDRIGKDRIGKDNIVHTSSVDDCPPAIDYQSVLDLFNQICVSLPKATKLTDTRRRKIKSVHKLLDGISFNDFFERVETSDFLTGRVKEWRADFDWIMQPKNAVKIIEGNYDNRVAVFGGAAASYETLPPGYDEREIQRAVFGNLIDEEGSA